MIYIDQIYSNYFTNRQNYVFTPAHITKKSKFKIKNKYALYL